MRTPRGILRLWNRLSLRHQATIWSASLLAATAGLLVLAVNLLASTSGPAGKDAGVVPIMTPVPGTALSTPASVQAIVRQADRDTVERVRVLSLIALAAAIVAGSAGTYWVTGLILRRVGQYTSITRLVDQRTLDARLPDGHHDELGELATEINAMMSRMEDAFTHQERFSDQLVHQLVNRITTVKASVDSISDYGFDANELVTLSRNTRVLFEAISGLVNIQHLTSLQSPECIQISDIIEDVVNECSEEALRLGISLSTTGISFDHWVRCNRDAVKIALVNLVDNAIAYGRPGGEVIIGTAESDDSVLVTIEDDGAGISRNDMARVFDVAFRGQQAAERRPEGAGLGLPIASYLVRRQGGAIEVQSLARRGTDVTVILPTARGPAAPQP